MVGKPNRYARAMRIIAARLCSTSCSVVAHVLALQGRRREAEALLAELEARAREHYVSPVAFCIVHLGLRNTDQVFQWLERAYQDRRGWLTYLKVDPMLDAVRDDPRFAAFVKRMKL